MTEDKKPESNTSIILELVHQQQDRIEDLANRVPQIAGYVKWWQFLSALGLVVTAIFTMLSYTMSAHVEQPHVGAATKSDMDSHVLQPHVGAVRQDQYEQDKRQAATAAAENRELMMEQINQRFDSLERRLDRSQ